MPLTDVELQRKFLGAWATIGTARDAIASLPGYGTARFFLFAKQNQLDRYAPRGERCQTVSVTVRCQYTLNLVERWIVLYLPTEPQGQV